jgi:hypothetical protein
LLTTPLEPRTGRILTKYDSLGIGSMELAENWYSYIDQYVINKIRELYQIFCICIPIFSQFHPANPEGKNSVEKKNKNVFLRVMRGVRAVLYNSYKLLL